MEARRTLRPDTRRLTWLAGYRNPSISIRSEPSQTLRLPAPPPVATRPTGAVSGGHPHVYVQRIQPANLTAWKNLRACAPGESRGSARAASRRVRAPDPRPPQLYGATSVLHEIGDELQGGLDFTEEALGGDQAPGRVEGEAVFEIPLGVGMEPNPSLGRYGDLRGGAGGPDPRERASPFRSRFPRHGARLRQPMPPRRSGLLWRLGCGEGSPRCRHAPLAGAGAPLSISVGSSDSRVLSTTLPRAT
jgi:hypothetical protein